MSKNTTASQRQDRLKAYKASGETVSQWCEHSGVTRTTLYRWLRLDAAHKAVTAKPEKKGLEAQIPQPAQIKWLPVTMSSEPGQPGNAAPNTNQHMAGPDMRVNSEIRVQIGGFLVIAPDGFKRETLKSVCQTLQGIC